MLLSWNLNSDSVLLEKKRWCEFLVVLHLPWLWVISTSFNLPTLSLPTYFPTTETNLILWDKLNIILEETIYLRSFSCSCRKIFHQNIFVKQLLETKIYSLKKKLLWTTDYAIASFFVIILPGLQNVLMYLPLWNWHMKVISYRTT